MYSIVEDNNKLLKNAADILKSRVKTIKRTENNGLDILIHAKTLCRDE